ncbi:MAG: response regulator transcription factor [Gemmatimonadaceae bacterium]|nr:response regulator transcription factor [Gemmatimonadaceae bacterium]
MRLLLVEDDPELSRTAAEYLRRTGFSVDAVLDGAGAMRMLRMNAYDAVVLDIRLPDADGFDICRQLRSMGSEARVLMATARDAVEDRVLGLDIGADDYLVKPYAMAELAARIRALLRRPAQAMGTVLTVADLELDVATRTARRGDRVIALTTKEFGVLEVLMRNAGAVLTREAISASAWDDNYDPFSNVIDVYIGRLRRKIDGVDEEPLVVTVRGAGYRIGSAAPDARPRA